ncbi:unnamed protein product [Brachionus calyciflorus]|uniref:Uncharacterized protein n=1 Tax=Brachionus calyciflorus TaxID=104777 RepID=A0A813MKV5_9BILA|nr:unnamed protein product [Brachionus calyciflorus]
MDFIYDICKKVIGVSENDHNIVESSHEIPEDDWHIPMNQNQIKTLSFIKKVKARITNGEDNCTAKIWAKDEQNKLHKTLATSQDKDEVASLIQSLRFKHGLQKRKSRNRPNLPSLLASIVIEKVF